MNLELDQLISSVAREPALLDEMALATFGTRVSESEIRMLVAKDLAGLRSKGAHPLLLMQFAGVFEIEPMRALGRQLPS